MRPILICSNKFQKSVFYSSLLIVFLILTSPFTNAQTKLWSMTSEGGQDRAGTIFSMDLTGSNYYEKPFTVENSGAYPSGALFKASNGLLYGFGSSGGINDKGVLFSFNPIGNIYNVQFDFDSINGSYPTGTLIQSNNGLLYGMTPEGGINNCGVIFNFNPVGNVFNKLLDLDSVDGSFPQGSLMQASNGLFYGLTKDGGINNVGVLFNFNPVGNVYTKLIDLDAINGANPYGSLLQAGNGLLYGLTPSGGVNGAGVLFSFNPASNNFIKLFDFDGTNGANPFASLIHAGNGLLYGTTRSGGINGEGVLFSFNTAGNIYTKLLDFDGINGSVPTGSLSQGSDSLLYGTTASGGLNNQGVLYSFNTNGNVFSSLYDFDGTNGNSPRGTLIQTSNGLLYGIANGGIYSYGVIFNFNPDSNAYSKLLDFNASSVGSKPYGSLMQARNGLLYGMTLWGGTQDVGVMFSFDHVTGDYYKLLDFDGSNGSRPSGSLIQSGNGLLYGLTIGGGIYNKGVLFSFNPVGNIYSVLLDFDGINKGQFPAGSLLQASNGLLYGMTLGGGINNQGVIFSFNPVGNVYSKLFEFDIINGAIPRGNLIQANNGLLYGIAEDGGLNNTGVLFSFNTAGNVYSKLFDFGNTNGAYPYGSLFQADNGLLYGMSSGGGSNGRGVLFSFNPTGNIYSTQIDFDGTNGGGPSGSLSQGSNGLLYGMTTYGGIYGNGVIFDFNPITNGYNKIRDLEFPDGITPFHSVFIEVPVISTDSVTTNYCAGDSLSFSFTATGPFDSLNIFTAQLSDSNGSFASPVNIGSIASASSGIIAAVIPVNTSSGTQYRIRVIGSYPYTVGSSNSYDIIITKVNNIITQLGSDTLISLASSANNYQWMYCSGNIISGDTTPIFVASTNGNYALIITENGCIDTSNCYPLTTVGINKNLTSDALGISIFPNPTNGIVYLKLNENSIQNFRIEVKDITGRIVFRTMSMQNKIIEMNLDGPAGVYFLNSSNELNTTFKIIKIE